MKNIILLTLFSGLILGITINASAHCEVPCGIYDDKARIEMIHEHITTIEKAMTEITELSSQEKVNYNQLIRWTTTKDNHATELQEIVFQYFMTQRIKSKDLSDAGAYSKYITELTLLHKMLVEAMKTKQTLDTSHTDALHKTLEEFNNSYFAVAETKGSGKGDKK